MESITQKFIAVIVALGMFYLVSKGFGNITVSTFLLYLTITLITRYPKVAITDPFILTDCAEVFMFLTAITLGYPLAVLMLFLGVWIPIAIEVRVESPLDSFDRTVSMLLALGMFAFFIKMGIATVTAIALGLFISSLTWSIIAFFVFNITNPSFFVVAFAKPIVFYRLLTSLGI